ncbi:MAG: DUF2653 family protein, partial [Tumebacillaceae bacterium]
RGVEPPVRLNFNEQDLVDSVCVFAAQRFNVNPQNLMVELFFNPQMGFSATAATRDNYHRFQLNEQDLIDAVAIFLSEQHRFDPHRLAIELFYEEGHGFSAVIDRH